MFVATDLGEEQMVLLAIDAKTGKQLAKHAVTPASGLINNIVVAERGNTVAISILAGNRSAVKLLDGRTLALEAAAKMPLGRASVRLLDDGKRLAVQCRRRARRRSFASIPRQASRVASRNEAGVLKACPRRDTVTD